MAETLIYLILAGLAGGFIAGLLGVGGGVFYILILPYALASLQVPQQELTQYIIANSLFGAFAAALSGSITLLRYKQIYPKETLLVSLGAGIASLLMLQFVVNTPWYTEKVFLAVVVVLLLFILIRTISVASQHYPTFTPPKP